MPPSCGRQAGDGRGSVPLRHYDLESPMRRPAKSPSFEDYLARHSEAPILGLVLQGHLVVEALLIAFIRLKEPGDAVYSSNFPAKTARCVSLGFLSRDEKSALDSINDYRNDLAHILGQPLNDMDVFRLLEKLGRAGFEFSDVRMWNDKAAFRADYGVEAGLIEAFNSVFDGLAFRLQEHGGPSFF